MGLNKVKMELIEKEKSRNLTFKKRKEGLMRKLHELTTLCDVKACMIIHRGGATATAASPEIWPPGEPDEVKRMIELYKAQKRDSRTFGLSDFFDERKKKVEGELAKQRKKTLEAKYPTQIEFLDLLNEAQLRDFASALANKAQFVRNRIELLKTNKQMLLCNTSFAMSQLHHQEIIVPPLNHVHYVPSLVQQAQQYYVPEMVVLPPQYAVLPPQYVVVEQPQLPLPAVENYGRDYEVGCFTSLMECDENEIGGLEDIIKNHM